MSDLVNSIHFSKKYSKLVYPIVNKRILEYMNYTIKIRSTTMRSYALEALDNMKFDLSVSSIFILYPHVNLTLATDVIFSFQAIIQYLNTICSHTLGSEEPFLKLIFSSLKDATNIRSDDFIKYFTFFPSKDDDGYLSILVEKCRQKVLLLPSFNIVRDYIVAYLSLYIDLQVTKYSSNDDNREMNLNNWINVYGQKYTFISGWEFCMSIDSPLTIQMFLALATNPDLTEQDVESINNTFFPWIPGIQKILEGYLTYNDTLFSRSVNYIFYYTNLKEYEDRIDYFVEQAYENRCLHFKHYRFIIKMLLIIYLSHPKASVGMCKMTSKVILRSGGRNMSLYSNVIKVKAKDLIP